jgi:hypothetical protein
MKRFALLMISLLALAAPAFAQINPLVGDLSVYADDQGSVCNINANGGGAFMQLPVIQKFSGGAGSGNVAIRFKITVPTGMSIIGFNTIYVPVGSVVNDLSVAFGVCISTTTVVGQLQVLSNTASPTCSYISVVAADNFATPIAADCSFGEYPMKTGQAIVNPDGTCQCSVATQPTSWGKVKALYR